MCAAALAGFRGAASSCAGMARRGVGAVEPSAPAQKRARHYGVDGGESGVPAPAAQRRLQERMERELAAVLGLLKKAELLSRSTGKRAAVVSGAGEDEEARFLAAKPRPEEDLGKTARKRMAPPSEPKNKPDDKAATAAPPPARETAMCHLMAEAEQARARRRREEIARERERFRRELEEVERAAPPDESVKIQRV
ncbi:hypothetical protein ACP4OV_028036 [Aristida adscensionis]